MPHPLEELYGLTAEELLSALNNRFRAKVALEGAVAEVQLGKQIQVLRDRAIITFVASSNSGIDDVNPEQVFYLSMPSTVV